MHSRHTTIIYRILLTKCSRCQSARVVFMPVRVDNNVTETVKVKARNLPLLTCTASVSELSYLKRQQPRTSLSTQTSKLFPSTNYCTIRIGYNIIPQGSIHCPRAITSKRNNQIQADGINRRCEVQNMKMMYSVHTRRSATTGMRHSEEHCESTSL